MAITRHKAHPHSTAEAFTAAAPDARPELKLRGKRRPLALTLPPDLVDRVDAVAARQERSRAKMVEILLRERLDEVEQAA